MSCHPRMATGYKAERHMLALPLFIIGGQRTACVEIRRNEIVARRRSTRSRRGRSWMMPPNQNVESSPRTRDTGACELRHLAWAIQCSMVDDSVGTTRKVSMQVKESIYIPVSQ
ncbi:hypothetical protein FA13DRAFT_468403 [Coprinellus micaceus]|uniref:Uncharacterized protein n=1 Tax=Coprinellus micaceus TaxID=71717 RepID=A0A4Y7TZS4_COPMI|nr:hypothetical protein FA13DRAFT_468403 [Coprinellus micaceus]